MPFGSAAGRKGLVLGRRAASSFPALRGLLQDSRGATGTKLLVLRT